MKNMVLPEVRLERPVVFLEQNAGGRKNWLLDRDQKDEDSRIHADETITGLTKISAIDLNLVLRGDSLADIFPLIGIVLPKTPAYSTKGRLMHNTRKWRYKNFGDTTGKSDI